MKKLTQGFTLIELIVVVAILGLVTGVAVPSFRNLMSNNAKVSEMRDLHMDFMIARAEAVKRGMSVVVCSNDGGDALACGGAWDRGWIVFLDQNEDGGFQDSDIIRSHGPLRLNRVEVVGNIGTSYRFLPQGFGATSGALVFCDYRTKASRGMLISTVGRTRMSDKDAAGLDWTVC